MVARAARLRPLLNYALPVVSTQALLEMARVYVGLADPGGARAVLRQANDIVQQRPALGTLTTVADELRSKVDSLRAQAVGASALTTAELRLLPLLPTHLSFREIGERLFLSRHTIKTQAISIYRKLGVSSRSETITRIGELGLLDTRVMTLGASGHFHPSRLTLSDGRSSCSRAVRLGPPRCRRRTARRR